MRSLSENGEDNMPQHRSCSDNEKDIAIDNFVDAVDNLRQCGYDCDEIKEMIQEQFDYMADEEDEE